MIGRICASLASGTIHLPLNASAFSEKKRSNAALPPTLPNRLMLQRRLLSELDFRPSGTLDVLERLDRSELHLAMGPLGVQGERFSRRRLLQDQFVVVHRKGHPAAKTREFSTEKLATLPQLKISSAQFGPDFAETRPERSKLGPRAAMRAPFLSAAPILATSDLVSVLPLNVAKSMTKSHQLVYRRLSRSPKPIEAAMIWLRRLDNQPAHAWLRDVIGRVTGDLQDT